MKKGVVLINMQATFHRLPIEGALNLLIVSVCQETNCFGLDLTRREWLQKDRCQILHLPEYIQRCHQS